MATNRRNTLILDGTSVEWYAADTAINPVTAAYGSGGLIITGPASTSLRMYAPNGVIIGAVGSAANLIFEESATISGQGTNTISLGQSGDTINLNVAGVTYNVGTTLAGNPTFSGNVTITGTLTVNGTTSTINSTTVTIDDPIFTLGGDTAPVADDNKDRGIEFRWHNGTTAKVGFFGYDDSLGVFTFIPDATNTSEVFSGTLGTLLAGSHNLDRATNSTQSALVLQTGGSNKWLVGHLAGSDDFYIRDLVNSTSVMRFTPGTTPVIALTGNSTTSGWVKSTAGIMYLTSAANAPYLAYGVVANSFTLSDTSRHWMTIDTTAVTIAFNYAVPITSARLTSTDSAQSLFVRTGTATSAGQASFALRSQTSSDMVDGFGGYMSFRIQDSAAVENEIAALYWKRNGADNTGLFSFDTAVAGSFSTRLTISGTEVAAVPTLQTYGQLKVRSAALDEGFRFQTQVSASNTSSRIFFVEAAASTHGFSLVYAGGANPTFDSQAFTVTDNSFALIRHNNDAAGTRVFEISRTSSNIVFYGNLLQDATNTRSLGTSSLRWSNTYSVLGDFSSNVTIGGNLLPATTDTSDLGSSTALWRASYISTMNALVFAENTIQTIGGWFYIAKSQGQIGGVAAGSADSVNIDFGINTLAVNDFIVIRAHNTAGAVVTEYMQITAFVSGTTYTVSRDIAGVVAQPSNYGWADGTPFVTLGYNGTGRIELDANSTPRIAMYKQGTAYNVQTEFVRIGDINGLGGVVTETYGMYIGSGSKYMMYDSTADALTVTGTINATAGNFSGNVLISGTLQTSASANTGIKISSTAIAGYNSSVQTVNIAVDGSGWIGLTGTRVLSWNTAGTVTIAGYYADATTLWSGNASKTDVATTVVLSAAAASPYLSFSKNNVAPGISYTDAITKNNVAWLGIETDPKFVFQASTSSYIRWDGSALSVLGGSITGSSFKTSATASTNGVVIDNTNNGEIRFYKASNNTLSISATGVGPLGGAGLGVVGDGTNRGTIYVNNAASWTDNAYDLYLWENTAISFGASSNASFGGQNINLNINSGSIGAGSTISYYGLSSTTTANGTFTGNVTDMASVYAYTQVAPDGSGTVTNAYGIKSALGSGLSTVTLYGVYSKIYAATGMVAAAVYGLYAEANPGGSYNTANPIYGAYVYGRKVGNVGTVYGTRTEAVASAASSNTTYALYSTASGATTNWAGYFAVGNVAIENFLNVGYGQVSPTTADYGIKFGSAGDTTLYRSAADTLKTDDDFLVEGPTSSRALTLNNSTLATVSVTTQKSPELRLVSNSWNTTTSASVTTVGRIQMEAFSQPGGGGTLVFSTINATYGTKKTMMMDEVGRVYIGEFTGQALGAYKMTIAGDTWIGFPEDFVSADLAVLGDTDLAVVATGETTSLALKTAQLRPTIVGDFDDWQGALAIHIRGGSEVSSTYYEKLRIDHDGKVWFNGTSTTAVLDTNLYRSAANTLKTDDALIVAGGFDALGKFVTTAPQPATNGGLNLGSDSYRWGNLYMADGAIILTDRTNTGTPTQDQDAHVFVYINGSNDVYLIIKWNAGGTIRYKYIRLDDTSSTWTYSSSLP